MNLIKKSLCTALAALSIVSSASAVNYVNTGSYFNNTITVSAATVFDNVHYAIDFAWIKYDTKKKEATFSQHDTYTKYTGVKFLKCANAKSLDAGLCVAYPKYAKMSQKEKKRFRADLAVKNKIIKNRDYNNYINSNDNWAANDNMCRLLQKGHLIESYTGTVYGCNH